MFLHSFDVFLCVLCVFCVLLVLLVLRVRRVLCVLCVFRFPCVLRLVFLLRVFLCFG